MNRAYRVLLLASHPVQYASPAFRQMAQHPQLDIQVAYCSLQGAERGMDPEFGLEVSWDVPLLEGYPWVRVPNWSPRPILGSFFGMLNPGLWKLVRRGGFDAVVAYTGYAYASFWIAVAAAKLSGKPLMFGTDATSLQPRNRRRWKVWAKRILLPWIFRLADIVIVPSTAGKELIHGLGIPEERIVLTPFIVDNEWWNGQAARVDRAAVRAGWGIPREAPVVVFCAKLQAWKRPQDVLRALAKLRVPGAHLVFAGEGPMREELEDEAKTLEVAERVRFLGFVNQSQLPAVYAASDLFVLPSEYDPCPAVVCEAMLCGCPAVISDEIRGRFDIVRQGETGFVYPCGDVEALAGILQDVLTDRKRLGRLREAARARMQTWSPRENVQALVRAVELALRAKSLREAEATP